MKQPYVARKMISAWELQDSVSRLKPDRLKHMARRDLYEHLEAHLDNVMDYVFMFNEEPITDPEHYNYGGTVIGVIAYPKDNFNGGAFA